MRNLQFLASGATQHVFVDPERAPRWVFKIPAIFDWLLPAPVTWQNSIPTIWWKQQVYKGLVLAPVVADRVSRLRNSGSTARVLRRMGAGFIAMLDSRLAQRAKTARIARFQEVCNILRVLANQSAVRSVLPFRLINESVVLDLGDGVRHEYDGPIVMQRKADKFFDLFADFECFDAADLVTAQHALWQCGVGLQDLDEVIGPRNWAMLEGKILLGDLGSLTTNLAWVRRTISAPLIANRVKEIHTWWPHTDVAALHNHVCLIQKHITPAVLERKWRTEI
jgi:hypothetical protein